MATIEQRAEAHANCMTGYSRDKRWYEIVTEYCTGANEQKKIDIDKAWKYIVDSNYSIDTDFDEFRKAMES